MYAHSPRDGGPYQKLVDHLRQVAELGAAYASAFGGADAVRWAGWLHDVGKANPAWQDYLAKCVAQPGRKHRSVDHKGAGALLALSTPGLAPMAFTIAGHHGGLPNQDKLRSLQKEWRQRDDIRLAQEWASAAGILPAAGSRFDHVVPDFARRNARASEFWLRMCFSALVDADFRDTERHFNPELVSDRTGMLSIPVLVERLMTAQAGLTGQHQDAVNQIRHEVYQACLAAAPLPPGMFRLTVPTGGGKTRSGLSFGLNHANAHGMDRVVVAVPFLTITDQTADVYRGALGADRAVLEHYSNAGTANDEPGEPTPREVWRRLAAQDWDAPVVVTTTVQLFESLFGNSTRACRKLHRLANAVIILDEVQTLPVALLEPMLDVLAELTTYYRTTVVLCTATQPAFARAPGFGERFASVREIALEPQRLFRSLRRVEYEWPEQTDRWSWARVADELRQEQRALAIVNTKRDALSLLDALGDVDTLHLSTALCAAHRRDVLAVIRRRLAAGRDCRVVSTQVVEAGVDLDFPVVFRAMAPLDSIVQAAGRCNREGKRDRGRVVIFQPEEGGTPGGSYKAATGLTEHFAADGPPDLHDPAIFDRYFGELYQLTDLDARRIQALRANFSFADVAEEFKLIDDDTVSVVVPYTGLCRFAADLPAERQTLKHSEIVADLLRLLAPRDDYRSLKNMRPLLARAQPYTVSLRRRAFEEAQRGGSVSELAGGLWKWERGYDEIRGLTFDADHERMIA
ncbi:MAG: CRISPR-associated endonuclease Cas3'' [Chloroflexota bacterium]|nr:CRISPR-associated endonuclease Cas3'' [Chloroflexota bacterium]